jgi:Na+/H+ antiporter NhaA
VIIVMYVLAFLAVYNGQILFATVPGDQVPIHVPTAWETGVVLGAVLGLTLFEWISIRKYTDSLLAEAYQTKNS